MKHLITALALTLTSSLAFAYPAVNDSVTYTGTYTEQGQTFPVTLSTSLTAYNAQAGQYQQNDVQTIAGETQTQDSWVDEGDLLGPDQVRYLIANCKQRGGTLETITSQAGVFNTCKVSQADSDTVQTYWFADVPFGIAQINTVGKTDEGQTYTIALTLTAVTFGQ
jgi:hypothetical protein